MYDRRAASTIIAGLARNGLFASDEPPEHEPVTIECTTSEMRTEADGVLTYSQRAYLERFMRPCPPEMVTSATHRVMWTDSDGIPNTGHVIAGGLGAVVPVVTREAVLSLWHDLAVSAALSDDERAVLADTTTDHEPDEIFRIGIEAAGRALAQHALLAHQTPYRTAAEFAVGMRASNLFRAVATQWFWELQASTYRRGMIPVSLTTTANGSVRYTSESVAMLKAMKESTIADAREVMRGATTEEGLSVEEAVQKYHHELDLIAKQYALLDDDTPPRCLGLAVQPVVVDRLVDEFVRLLATVEVVVRPAEADADDTAVAEEDRVFHVPDMNCRHCEATIRGVLGSMDIDVLELDLTSKRIVAEFRSLRNRQRALDAVRDSGYTPVT